LEARGWNQRYCQDPECQRLVRRWQAAKRQRHCRENDEGRRRHCEAERRRRERRRAETSRVACVSTDGRLESSPAPMAEGAGAWSRSKKFSGDFCDRVGCYELVRPSCRPQARYCGDACRQAIRCVLDRERKWLRRNTDAGRFKRRLEYERARSRRVTPQDSKAQWKPATATETVTDGSSAGRHLSGFL